MPTTGGLGPRRIVTRRWEVHCQRRHDELQSRHEVEISRDLPLGSPSGSWRLRRRGRKSRRRNGRGATASLRGQSRRPMYWRRWSRSFIFRAASIKGQTSAASLDDPSDLQDGAGGCFPFFAALDDLVRHRPAATITRRELKMVTQILSTADERPASEGRRLRFQLFRVT
jgi:hypothetical protein